MSFGFSFSFSFFVFFFFLFSFLFDSLDATLFLPRTTVVHLFTSPKARSLVRSWRIS
jgi:hypothetical protein